MIESEHTLAPKRRWFRFRLSAMLLVVTVVGSVLGWLVYCQRWESDRLQVNQLRNSAPWDVQRVVVGSDAGGAPWPLWLTGSRGYDQLGVQFFDGNPNENQLSGKQRETLEAIRLIFPEAVVEVVPRRSRMIPHRTGVKAKINRP